MKIALLSVIAIVGLAILGGMGWLAFGQADVAQQDFEREYTPVAATPAAVPQAATPAVAQQPALIMPEAPAPAEAPAAVETTDTPAAAPTTLVLPEDNAATTAESAPSEDPNTIPMPAQVPVATTPAPTTSAAPSE